MAAAMQRTTGTLRRVSPPGSIARANSSVQERDEIRDRSVLFAMKAQIDATPINEVPMGRADQKPGRFDS